MLSVDVEQDKEKRHMTNRIHRERCLRATVGLLIATTLVFGCNTIRSSCEYTMGTDCLEYGDYDEAIKHLKRAVEFCPNVSKNQNNLAAAYASKGELLKAWYHSKEAVMLDPINREHVNNFKRLFNAILQQILSQSGGTIPKEEVIRIFGLPDISIPENDANESRLIYGYVTLNFKQGLMVEMKEEQQTILIIL